MYQDANTDLWFKVLCQLLSDLLFKNSHFLEDPACVNLRITSTLLFDGFRLDTTANLTVLDIAVHDTTNRDTSMFFSVLRGNSVRHF